MKLINQSVTLVEENNPLKLVELAGRVSHKSEDKITDDSYKKFLIYMLGYGHTATLEFGDVYLDVIDTVKFHNQYDDEILLIQQNAFCHVRTTGSRSFKLYTNLRYILDKCPALFNDLLNNGLPYYINSFIPEDNDPYKRYCFDIVCNRGVSHELVRHRNMSFLQESTRYCNYSKDKFSNELNIINPFNNFIKTTSYNHEIYLESLKESEDTYNDLTNCEDTIKAQEARGILPNDLKTELYMTGFLKDWIGHNRETFSIDLFGETVNCKVIKGFDTLRNDVSAHPQAREIAGLVNELLLTKISITEFEKIKDTYYE